MNLKGANRVDGQSIKVNLNLSDLDEATLKAKELNELLEKIKESMKEIKNLLK